MAVRAHAYIHKHHLPTYFLNSGSSIRTRSDGSIINLPVGSKKAKSTTIQIKSYGACKVNFEKSKTIIEEYDLRHA